MSDTERKTLFQIGCFRLSGGSESKIKIDCDALTDADLETCAALMAAKAAPFYRVLAVPTGGDRIAQKLERYVNPTSNTVLIVDDVLTTGASIEGKVAAITTFKGPEPHKGFVIFARGQLPEWVQALFVMQGDS